MRHETERKIRLAPTKRNAQPQNPQIKSTQIIENITCVITKMMCVHVCVSKRERAEKRNNEKQRERETAKESSCALINGQRV